MKKKLKGIMLACLALLLVGLAVERPAKAYADPGSGALLWQGLLGGLLGLSYYSRRIIRWFQRRMQKD